MMDEYDTDINTHRATNHKGCLEVIDDESNIRAFLISFGISLSGKAETNRENLIQACKKHNPPLQLFWINPNKPQQEYTLQVDDPQPQKSKRGRKKKQPTQT